MMFFLFGVVHLLCGMVLGMLDLLFGVYSHISGMLDFVFGVYSHINIAAAAEVVEDEKMA